MNKFIDLFILLKHIYFSTYKSRKIADGLVPHWHPHNEKILDLIHVDVVIESVVFTFVVVVYPLFFVVAVDAFIIVLHQ